MKKYLLIGVLFLAVFFVPSVKPAMADTYAWTSHSGSSGIFPWVGLSSSSDGLKVDAVETGSSLIWTSSTEGASWTNNHESSGHEAWGSIVSSSNGTKLLAGILAVLGHGMSISNDEGISWVQVGPTGGLFYSVASSADGIHLAAADATGYIWISNDSGHTWTDYPDHSGAGSSGSHNWQGVAISSDGSRLYAIDEGYFWISTDGGVSWHQQISAGHRAWYKMSSSRDLTKIALVADGNSVFISTNSGATWAERIVPGSSVLGFVSISQDGQNIITFSNYGYIYTSQNGGLTWSPETSFGIRSWTTLAASDDAKRVFVAENGGYIYTGSMLPIVSTVSASSLSLSRESLKGTLTNFGDATSADVSFDYAPGISGTTYTGHTAPVHVSATGIFTDSISGLTCGTPYHYRAVATSVIGANYGSDMTFTTPCPAISVPPAVAWQVWGDLGLSGLTNKSISLGAELVNPLDSLGGPDDVSFRISHIYENSYTNIPAGSLGALGSFSTHTTLACGTMWRVHPKAINPVDPTHLFSPEPTGLGTSPVSYVGISGHGTAIATDQLIDVPGCGSVRPMVENVSAVPGTTNAVLTGKLTDFGHGSPVKVFFGYGTGPAYGPTWVGFTPAVTRSTLGTFNATITGLACGQLYHYITAVEDGVVGNHTAVSTFTTTACITSTTGGGSTTTTLGGGAVTGTGFGITKPGSGSTTTNANSSASINVSFTGGGCSVTLPSGNNTGLVVDNASGKQVCLMDKSPLVDNLSAYFRTVFSAETAPATAN